MNAAVYAGIALLCYTVFNTIFARTLSHITPSVALPIYTSVVVVLGAMVFYLTKNSDTRYPTGGEVGMLMVCGLALLAADYAFVSAYNKGGSVAMIATILSLLPVTTAILNLFLSGSMPRWEHVVAFAMAIGSVAIIVWVK